MELAAKGMTVKETARAIGLGVETVKGHAAAARLKLGARNTVHAVALMLGGGNGGL